MKKFKAFHDWLSSSSGEALLDVETALLKRHLSHIGGANGLLLGSPEQYKLTSSWLIKDCTVLTPLAVAAELPLICANYLSLPIAPESVHGVLLPHTLEFTPKPHQVLREVELALRPEGHVVILGFNMLSMWGVIKHLSDRGPCGATFHRMTKVMDWLRLLNFDILVAEHALYSGMVRVHAPWLERCFKACFPFLGSLYMIVARKAIFGMRLRPAWQERAKFAKKRIIKPVTRNMCEQKIR